MDGTVHGTTNDYDQGCRASHISRMPVGWNACNMLGRFVNAAREIRLTVPQVEFLQERVPDLHYMENVMWEHYEKMGVKPTKD